MKELHEPVKHCLKLGHTYSDTTVVRCQHTEAYTVRSAVWDDNRAGDTTVLWSRVEEFGPFDELDDVIARVAELSAMAVRYQMVHEAL